MELPQLPSHSLLACLHPFFPPSLPFFCLFVFLWDHACSHNHVCSGQTADKRGAHQSPLSFNFHPPFTPLLWCPLRLQEGGHRCPIWDQALNNQSFAILCPVTSPHVGHMHASYFNIWSIANSFWCKIWGVFKVCFLWIMMVNSSSSISWKPALPLLDCLLNLGQGPASHVFGREGLFLCMALSPVPSVCPFTNITQQGLVTLGVLQVWKQRQVIKTAETLLVSLAFPINLRLSWSVPTKVELGLYYRWVESTHQLFKSAFKTSLSSFICVL